MGFEHILSASETCCPFHCAMGVSPIVQISAETQKQIKRQRFEPGPAA